MSGFEVGDRVRLDIPDQNDPDFARLHWQTGEIKETMKDDADLSTGDERDSILYRVGAWHRMVRMGVGVFGASGSKTVTSVLTAVVRSKSNHRRYGLNINIRNRTGSL